MMFSKKYKLIHQGTGTIGSGGWTDLGKQSVFVFGAYSSGVLRVASKKRGPGAGVLETGLCAKDRRILVTIYFA